MITLNTINHLPGPYRRTPIWEPPAGTWSPHPFGGAYRGSGRPEAAFVMERLIDRAARRLGLDPAEIRRRNLVRPDEMPHRTGLIYRDGTPISYDPADYPGSFRAAPWKPSTKRAGGSGRRSAAEARCRWG